MGKPIKRTTTTTYLPWVQAQSLLKLLCTDGDYNTGLMCAVGFYTGLRIGDILSLTWGQIKGDRMEVVEQKTGKFRKIELHPEFKKLVRQCLASLPDNCQPTDSAYIFVEHRATPKGKRAYRRTDRKKPITVVAAIKRFKKALERYGIETENPSTHTLRKTFGRRVWENNGKSEAALVLLAEIFNHSKLSVTRRYLGITQDEISQAYLTL